MNLYLLEVLSLGTLKVFKKGLNLNLKKLNESCVFFCSQAGMTLTYDPSAAAMQNG